MSGSRGQGKGMARLRPGSHQCPSALGVWLGQQRTRCLHAHSADQPGAHSADRPGAHSADQPGGSWKLQESPFLPQGLLRALYQKRLILLTIKK